MKTGITTPQISIKFCSEEFKQEFIQLVNRGAGLWPDASPDMKAFVDILTHGYSLQDYYAQANVPVPSQKVESDMTRYEFDLKLFNEVYSLQQVELHSREAVIDRLKKFKVLLQEEMRELDDLMLAIAAREIELSDALTELADFCGDMHVYCGSEMVRWNIPVDAVLEIIMRSNMSKLGEDGRPIKREDGKVMKGPNYWKPEPKIKELLLKKLG